MNTFSKSIRIDNVVVTTNEEGTFRSVTPIRLLERQGINYSDVPHMTYGNRVVDNAMIMRLLGGQVTFHDALNHGTVVA